MKMREFLDKVKAVREKSPKAFDIAAAVLVTLAIVALVGIARSI